MQNMADEAGPDWNPPEPESVTIIGFLGRIAVGETPPKRRA